MGFEMQRVVAATLLLRSTAEFRDGAVALAKIMAKGRASARAPLKLPVMRILGIESSCDETGVALVQTTGEALPRLLSHALYSQIDMHQAYGGVVPELASRDHIRRVLPLTRQVLAEAGATLAGTLLRLKLVDELIVYIAPKLLGNTAQPLAVLPQFNLLDNAIALHWTDVRMVGQDLRLTAKLAP